MTRSFRLGMLEEDIAIPDSYCYDILSRLNKAERVKLEECIVAIKGIEDMVDKGDNKGEDNKMSGSVQGL